MQAVTQRCAKTREGSQRFFFAKHGAHLRNTAKQLASNSSNLSKTTTPQMFIFGLSKRNKMEQQKQDGRAKNNIEVGQEVEIVQKHHQRSGELTFGIVKRILTKSANHSHGIKVQLTTGEVGRVKEIL